MSEESIRTQVKKYLVGEWYCEKLNLSTKISESTRGIRYLFEYDNTPFEYSNEIEELVEMRYIDEESPIVHLSSKTWSLPMLRFLNVDTFQLLKEHPETKEISVLIFIRKDQSTNK